LRVTLRHFAASQHCDGTAAGLWAFIVESLVADGLADFAALLRQRLLDGGVLLVCDGLDEVADEEDRRAVQDAVAGLATTYNHPANRYLVTCRIYAYQDPCWHLEGFAAHTLAPFNQEQVDAFVDCWYREACRLGWKTEAEAGALTQGLQAATRRADLAPLARSPLQLTMMASLHFSWGRLPDDRAELYQQMVDLLLVRWQEARLGEGTGLIEALTAGELVSALEQVAFEAHRAQGTSEGPADLSEAALLSVLVDSLGGSWGRAQELLAYIRERAGLLLEREPGVYTFPHRSYQEYLAGSYLAREPDFPDLAADLVRDNYSQWREVVLWAVGIMARLKRMTHVAVGVADALCPPPLPQAGTGWRAAHLAGEALLETGLVKVRARERHAQVLDRVQARLVALLEENALPARERAAAGNTLSDLDDPRFRAEAWFLPDEPLFGFVPVPAGPFLMGTREDDIPALLERFGGERGWYEREVPQHTVELPDYYIARYPVTVAQFRAFAQDSGHKPGREASLPGLSAGGLPNHPVVNVTWYDAVAYSQWLAEQLRGFDFGLWMANLTDDALTAQSQDLRDRIQDQGWQVRLPSEAEWEKAARGMEERFFPWGDDVDPDRANYFDTRIGATSAVGCFSGGASPYGVLDLGGNVWEWTQSLYRDYPYNLTDGREELDDNGSRVLRGGAFHYNGWRVRCAFRFRYYPRRRFNVFGFRVVVAPG
jgi:formylglycine-generating enzyme required for sulfatase activity